MNIILAITLSSIMIVLIGCKPVDLMTTAPSSFSDGTVGKPYDETITITEPKSFITRGSVSNKNLPPGLILSLNDGENDVPNSIRLSGVPTKAGKFLVNVRIGSGRIMTGWAQEVEGNFQVIITEEE